MTEQPTATARRRKPPKVRGIYEKVKGSGVWWVSYRDCAGRRRREKAGTRGMALALLDRRRDERRRGVKLPETIRRKAVTVGTLLGMAAEHVRAHYSTQRLAAKGSGIATDSRYPALLAEFGSLAASALTPQRIEQGLSKLAAEREWSTATVNCHQAFLSLAYRLGLANGKVQANPARLVRRRQPDNARVRYLTPEEETRLRAVIRADWPGHEPELDLALHTGLRMSNQYGLRWADIDWERSQAIIGRAKNGRPHYARLNSAAVQALLRLKAMAGDSEWVIVNADTAKSRYKGQPRRRPRNWFEAAVAKAAIPDFTWHCLRHTFASRLIMAGVDLRTVQELMGHRTIQMTCRYAHLSPAHEAGAVEQLVGFAGVQSGTRSGTGDFGEPEAQPAISTRVPPVQ